MKQRIRGIVLGVVALAGVGAIVMGAFALADGGSEDGAPWPVRMALPVLPRSPDLVPLLGSRFTRDGCAFQSELQAEGTLLQFECPDQVEVVSGEIYLGRDDPEWFARSHPRSDAHCHSRDGWVGVYAGVLGVKCAFSDGRIAVEAEGPNEATARARLLAATRQVADLTDGADTQPADSGVQPSSSSDNGCALDAARVSSSLGVSLTPLEGDPCTFFSDDRKTVVGSHSSGSTTLAAVRAQVEQTEAEVVEAPEIGDGAFVRTDPGAGPDVFRVLATYERDGVATTVVYAAPQGAPQADDPRAAVVQIVRDGRR